MYLMSTVINHKGFKIRQKFIHIKLYSCHCPVEVADFLLALKCCCCCCSMAQSYLTLCDPLDCSTAGFPVLHQLLELSQTHVHPTISSSVAPCSSRLQSFPASGSFPMSQFFASGGQNIGSHIRQKCPPQCSPYSALTSHLTSLVPQMVKDLPATQETWVWSLGSEDPREKGTATHSSILAWRMPMDRGAWRATVHGVVKSRTWLSDFHFTMPTFQQEFSLSWGYKNWLLTHKICWLSLVCKEVSLLLL